MGSSALKMVCYQFDIQPDDFITSMGVTFTNTEPYVIESLSVITLKKYFMNTSFKPPTGTYSQWNFSNTS